MVFICEKHLKSTKKKPVKFKIYSFFTKPILFIFHRSLQYELIWWKFYCKRYQYVCMCVRLCVCVWVCEKSVIYPFSLPFAPTGTFSVTDGNTFGILSNTQSERRCTQWLGLYSNQTFFPAYFVADTKKNSDLFHLGQRQTDICGDGGYIDFGSLIYNNKRHQSNKFRLL